jgi:hypothetical protein
VLVLPITHTTPQHADDAIEIQTATKQRLGLDAERSWIVISEVNEFVWPGPDLWPPQGGTSRQSYMARCHRNFLPTCATGFLRASSATKPHEFTERNRRIMSMPIEIAAERHLVVGQETVIKGAWDEAAIGLLA